MLQVSFGAGFLWRAPEQSGFDDSIRRMQCDQNLIV